MRHARDQDLDRIEPLLAQIRAATPQGLKEKKRGVFYFRSQAFLHFHEDAKSMFADVGLGKGFERLQVDDAAGAAALLARVAAVGR